MVKKTKVVILIGSPMTPNMITAIKRHYCEDSYRRWKRLGLNMTHLIPDLLYLFTDWTSTLASLKRILQDAEMRSISGSVPVTAHTRILHHQIAVVIELRESLRFQQAVIGQTMNSQKQGWGDSHNIRSQLDRMEKQMAHNAITLDTVKDQLANLIQLEFNLAAVSEGQSVSRISNLAFIYIPLTYVATLFAMPGIGIKPVWYPVVAIPLMLLSVGVALFAEKLVKFRERKDIFIHQENPMSSERVSIIPFSRRSRHVDTDIEDGSYGSTVSEQPDVFPPITNPPISSTRSVGPEYLESPPSDFDPEPSPHYADSNSPGVPESMNGADFGSPFKPPYSSLSKFQENGKSGLMGLTATATGNVQYSSDDADETTLEESIKKDCVVSDGIVEDQIHPHPALKAFLARRYGATETSSARPYRELSDAGVASTLRRRWMP